MPAILIYILKVSFALSVVFLFYHIVLRRLTFYNWNRWYLILYSVLCFFIPFIDISNAVDSGTLEDNTLVKWVPIFNTSPSSVIDAESGFNLWPVVLGLLLFGVAIMLTRLLVQLFSFKKMYSKAKLISDEGVKVYQVEDAIIPFSFGNAVFINPSQHTAIELEEIILHEFIHVRQRHSIDIIFAEFLCLLNWFNPFAWLIRRAIRQNLEFVADNEVLENGIDKKQYQYLLLKVIGNNNFSIAQKFNFSSLKKRIAMMNKNKSARVHVLRFLFVLPVIALILVSFRNNISHQKNQITGDPQMTPGTFIDTIPAITKVNSKGFIINIIDKNGQCELVIKDASKKEVKRMLLTEWNSKSEYYENLYGNILLPPDPPAPPAPPTPPGKPREAQTYIAPDEGTPSAWRKILKEYEVSDKTATLVLNDGTIERYDLQKPAEKAEFEKKYSDIILVRSPKTPGSYGDSYSPGAPAYMHEYPSSSFYTPTPSPYGYEITGDELITITIRKTTTEKELKAFIVQMKEKGIDLQYDDIIIKDGKLVKLTGHMRSGGSHSNFVATDFEKLVLAMIKDGDKVWFKVNVHDKPEVI